MFYLGCVIVIRYQDLEVMSYDQEIIYVRIERAKIVE
jgi:hypothetical protein